MTEPRANSEASDVWSMSYAALLVCTAFSGALVGYFFYVVLPYIRIPADFLMFAESDFVGTILKLRGGLPLYPPAADNNSLVYPPLAPVLTYAVAWTIGQATSIPAYRAVQIGYAGVATIVGVACCWRLYAMRWPDRRPAFPKTYSVFAALTLFLAATAPRVNPYSTTLHADALALVVTACTFWMLLSYLDRPTTWRLIVLAACPAIGFLTKQFLLIWAPLVCVAFLLDQPRRVGRVVIFALLAAAFYGAVVATCYLLWGDAFMFYVFEVVGGQRRQIGLSPNAYNISLIRSMNHLLIGWLEIAIGAFGAWALLQNGAQQRLRALVVAWVLLIAGETVTSGAGWHVLYHFGPGVLIGTILLIAAGPGYWPQRERESRGLDAALSMAGRSAMAVVAVVTVTMALHVTPTGNREQPRSFPPRRPSPDLHRYISDIEREFDGIAVDQVLLDVGNWIYLRHGYLAKDRAASTADQPPIGIYRNIEAFAGRIREGRYARILVRNFHSPYFLYDWHDWPRPSGVRDALLRHYQEVRVIPAVKDEDFIPDTYTGPVSVFERQAQR